MPRLALSFLAALVLALVPSLTARASGDGAARLQTALDDLAVMESLLGGTMNEPTRRELLSKLQAVRRELRAVQQELLRGGSQTGVTVSGPGGALVAVTVHEDPPGPAPVHVVGVADVPMPPEFLAMGGGPFDLLKVAIHAEPFGDKKLDILREAVRSHRFNVDQVIELLPMFTFSDERVDAAVMLHPVVVDPEVWFRVYDHFDFDSDKEEVRKRLGL